MPGFLKVILQGLFLKFMREKVRQGSLHAVRFYIGLVQQVRLVSMAAVGVTATAAVVVVGFAFIIGGALFLLPISAANLPYVFIGVGCFAVLIGALSLRTFFKEEHWMEMSEAYTLMNKVMTLGEDPMTDFTAQAKEFAASRSGQASNPSQAADRAAATESAKPYSTASSKGKQKPFVEMRQQEV